MTVLLFPTIVLVLPYKVLLTPKIILSFPFTRTLASPKIVELAPLMAFYFPVTSLFNPVTLFKLPSIVLFVPEIVLFLPMMAFVMVPLVAGETMMVVFGALTALMALADTLVIEALALSAVELAERVTVFGITVVVCVGLKRSSRTKRHPSLEE